MQCAFRHGRRASRKWDLHVSQRCRAGKRPRHERLRFRLILGILRHGATVGTFPANREGTTLAAMKHLLPSSTLLVAATAIATVAIIFVE